MSNWIVVEGTDFSGKSTLCKTVNDLLVSFGKTSEVFQHPGALSTGKELRSIIKSTSDLDWLTEQLIPCADFTNFVANINKLAATRDVIVSDRISAITGPAFALSKNNDIAEIKNLFTTILNLTATRITFSGVKTTLVLLDTPPDRIIEERIQNRQSTNIPVDHFDTRKQIRKIYKTLFSTVLHNVPTVLLNPDDTHNESVNTINVETPELSLVNSVILPSITALFDKVILVKQPFDVLKNARKIIDTL